MFEVLSQSAPRVRNQQVQQYKTMGALVTNKSNASVEGFYFSVASRDIVNDIRNIPTR